MASRYIWSATFRSYTATAVGSTAVAEHPASAVGRYTLPSETWRGVGGFLRLALPTPQVVKAVFLNNLNFSVASLTIGSDSYNSVSVPIDGRVDRRKVWIPTLGSGSGSLGNQVDIFPIQAGTPYHELGAVVLVGDYTELPENPEPPLRYTRRQGVSQKRFPSRRLEQNTEGSAHLEYAFGAAFWRNNIMLTHLHAILNVGYAPLVIYENAGDTSQAYLVQRVEDTEIARDPVLAAANFRFEEFTS